MTVNTSNSTRHVARGAGTVGGMTLVSRVGGLVRDAVFANVFGAGTASDAYLMAFTIPNTFRTLVAEGSLTVAFLPEFRRVESQGGSRASLALFAQATFIFPGIAAVLAGLAVLFAEPLVALFAPGFREVPGKFELTVRLTRIMFAYLPLVSFVALAMGALNARGRFASSAISPAFFNLTVIIGLTAIGALSPILADANGRQEAIVGVGWFVVLGGASQVLVQTVSLARAGLLSPPVLVWSPAIRRILVLMLPSLGALAVHQLNILIVRNLASSLPEGAVTSLFYADRFFQLPLGVFGIAIATAALPALADAYVAGGGRSLVEVLSRALELCVWIAIPATLGLMTLAIPICATVLQHGALSHAEARQAAAVLVCLAPGLLPVASLRVISQAFFSIQDTKTPVACTALGVASNLAMAPVLAERWGASGLALSVTLAAWIQLFAQTIFLRRRLGTLAGANRLVRSAIRAIVIALPMALGVGASARFGVWSTGFGLRNVVVLGLAVVVGTASYGAIQWVSGSTQARALVQRIWVGSR